MAASGCCVVGGRTEREQGCYGSVFASRMCMPVREASRHPVRSLLKPERAHLEVSKKYCFTSPSYVMSVGKGRMPCRATHRFSLAQVPCHKHAEAACRSAEQSCALPPACLLNRLSEVLDILGSPCGQDSLEHWVAWTALWQDDASSLPTVTSLRQLQPTTHQFCSQLWARLTLLCPHWSALAGDRPLAGRGWERWCSWPAAARRQPSGQAGRASAQHRWAQLQTALLVAEECWLQEVWQAKSKAGQREHSHRRPRDCGSGVHLSAMPGLGDSASHSLCSMSSSPTTMCSGRTAAEQAAPAPATVAGGPGRPHPAPDGHGLWLQGPTRAQGWTAHANREGA